MAPANDATTVDHKVLHRSTGERAVQYEPPRLDWSTVQPSEHVVQFYETDAFLLAALTNFINAGLRAGEAAIVIATPAHRNALEEGLQAGGLDVVRAMASGQYVVLDAAETLATFMVNGMPDPARVDDILSDIIATAAADRPHVRIFGEMVALLWADGQHAAALQLEALWNKLHETQAFVLFCAYPITGLGGTALAQPMHDICAAHSRIIPAESYTALTNTDDRLRAIVRLQHEASLLHAEIAKHQQTEAALRTVNGELAIQVEDLRRLHEMSVNLTSTLDLAAVLREVLDAALKVQASDHGMLSLCEPEQEGIALKVSRGFDAAVLQQLAAMASDGGVCGAAFAARQRIVVEDIDVDPRFIANRAAARLAGVRACHSTPLLTRTGTLIGVLSVYFRQPYRPAAREIRLMDLYAQMAADFVENARLHQQVQDELDVREQALRREQAARAEAERANRLKDEFLATVSHELRTPLTTMLGWSQHLQRRKLDEATLMRGLEIIERSAIAQAQLVDDILDVARMMNGTLRLELGAVDLAAIVTAAIDTVQVAADAKNVHLEATVEPAARQIVGDTSRLQQVVWNLLTNAIKFTPSGGSVSVRMERAGSATQLTVSDTGEGISADVLPYIFERGRQADGTSTRRHGGLGLGLSIVRHLVELHGGTVQATSAGVGTGTTFTIRLPRVNEQKNATSGRHTMGSEGPAEATDPSLHPLVALAAVQVLLVDDDREILEFLTLLLTEAQATVQTATSAAEALEALQSYTPDVLVSDVAMPDEDGYMLLEKVRAYDEARGTKTPAVALTAYARSEDRVRALASGFDMFVPKPVDPHALITAIAELVAARRNGVRQEGAGLVTAHANLRPVLHARGSAEL